MHAGRVFPHPPASTVYVGNINMNWKEVTQLTLHSAGCTCRPSALAPRQPNKSQYYILIDIKINHHD